VNNYIQTPEEGLHYGKIFVDLVEKGVLDTIIFREYPFTAEGVKQAHEDLTSGKTIGKLVIKV